MKPEISIHCKKTSKTVAFILIISILTSILSLNASVVQAKDLFPVKYETFGHTYTITGYQIGKSDDGKTTITFFGPDPGAFIVSGGSLYPTIDCMFNDNKNRYSSISAEVTGNEKIVFKFNTTAKPDEIWVLLMPPGDDGWASIVMVIEVASTPQSSGSTTASQPKPEPTTPAPAPAPAPKPVSSEPKNGDRLGDVLNSNVKTYINGERIPCYNIKNKAVILVTDLNNYGFDTVYDNATRTSKITRNFNKNFKPIQGIQNTTSGESGTVAFSYLYTDIVAYLGGKKIESFNVQGSLAIFFEDLAPYGSFKWDDATKSSRLTLTPPEPSGVSISPSSTTVDVGKTTTLSATVTPSNADNKTMTWSSSNTGVATVSSTGVVTGVSKGTATITAKTANGKTSTCTVTVRQPIIEPSGVSISPSSATVDVGKTTTLSATVTPSNADNKTVTWSTSNVTIAAVSSSGVVAGVSKGTAIITAETANGKTATCTVTVNQVVTVIEPSGVSISPSSATVDVGKTTTLSATVTPSNADNMTVTWNSSNTKVATVSSAGVVTGVSKGTVTITARTSNGKTSTCTVIVRQAAATEYYPGTTYRTFTDVTGTKLKTTYVADNGIKIYVYDLKNNNMSDYMDYLFGLGFKIFDYPEDTSIIFMEKGNHLFGIFHYLPDNEVWIAPPQ